jgi:hypothetical protein
MNKEERKEYDRKRHLVNKRKDSYNDRRRKANRKRTESVKAWLRAYKATQSCQKCEENHPACLDFHHRNPSEKECEVGNAPWRGWSIKKLEKEISKCDVLCANCHRKLHH